MSKLILTKKYRVANKRRFTFSIMLLVIMLSVLGNTAINTLAESNSSTNKKQEITSKYNFYTVSEGDTLWSITKKYASNKIDPRDFIDEIQAINNINDSSIVPGQTLKIPVK